MALARTALRPARRRRSARARATEAGWLAALAQRWFRAPAALGGPADPARGFRDVSVAALGLSPDPRDPAARRTASGTYRLIAVPPCAALRTVAERLGVEASVGGGLLVVGTGGRPGEAVAVLVLGPLVQVALDAVPWLLVRALTTPRADPLLPAEPTVAVRGKPVVAAPRRTRPLDIPQHARRLPSWRSPKPTTRRRAARRATE